MKTRPKNFAAIPEIPGKGVVAMKLPDDLQERDVELHVTQFPSGCRDFSLVQRDEDGRPRLLNPLELLVLDRGADLIEQETFEPKAMNLALCRLLVPSLRTERVGRHLVVEEWSERKARGGTLGEEVHSYFAQELSREQENVWRLVTSGEKVPNGSLAALMWDAVTELPALPARFDDPDLGRFAKALYFHVVEPGEGRAEFDGWREINRKIEECRATDFEQLNLSISPAELRKLFRKYMAVTIRWTSKMTGQLALDVVNAKLDGGAPFTERELALLNLRYGDSAIFGNINVGFLFGCGPLFADFFNDIYCSIADGAEDDESNGAAGELLRFVYLHRNYLQFRRAARRDQKADLREHFRDPITGQRRQASDPKALLSAAEDPVQETSVSEEMLLLQEKILPALENAKPEYGRLLRLFIEKGGDMEAAAAAAQLPRRNYSRRLRETIFPAVQKVARNLGLASLLES